jgi:hypothetical protein
MIFPSIIQIVKNTARSPAKRPPVTISNLVVGTATDLEGEWEACAEDVGDEVS